MINKYLTQIQYYTVNMLYRPRKYIPSVILTFPPPINQVLMTMT